MIIGAYLDRAAPEHGAGAEWTIHDTMTWLARRGHDCRVVAAKGHTQERIDNVLVYSNPTADELAQHFMESDVMLTQLDAIAHAQILAFTYQTPLVHFVHSATQLERLGVMDTCSALVVFNAAHVASACDWWPGEGMTLRPPIDADRVRVARPGEAAETMVWVTLVNLSHNKGAMTMWYLAESLEQRPFLGVMGVYGEQAITQNGIPGHGDNPLATGLRPNMRVHAPVRDIREVLRYTRVLLVLSLHETYGRIAGEAAVSGIPVIATRTPGLVECLGDAGLYFDDRNHLATIAKLIERAYTPEWVEMSTAAGLRWHGCLGPRQELELRAFERHLARIHRDKPEMIL